MPVDGTYGNFSDPSGDPAALDPHRDWPGPYDTWELYRCCLARNLLSTNGRSVDRGGSHMQPDVAARPPEISADGLTWTFRLKTGLRYAPPLDNVEITAQDFIRSFHRLMTPDATDEYWPTLFEDVVGASEYRDGAASSIAGFSSPDPHTLVIRLTEPSGDLAPRLATSGVIPVPPNLHNPQAPLGIAEGHDDGFGRFAVSSGPYMIEGTPELDFSLPPEEQTGVTGLIPGRTLVLVPNPSWDPATDLLRAAIPGRIEVEVVATPEEAIARTKAATADIVVNMEVPHEEVPPVRADPDLGQVFVYEAGGLLGVTMRVAMPPFDDIHVRRAVQHVINKAAAIEANGGPLSFRIAHHIAPDSMEDNLLIDYRPYGSPAGTGDIDRALAEMKQSRYDTNGDGICDAEACRDVVVVIGSPALEEPVSNDLERIGITLTEVTVDAVTAYTDPTVKVALLLPQGWGRDYLSASNFFVGQFYSPAALSENGNGSLVGASAEQLADWGYDVTEVPNVDARIEACIPLTGAAQFECWAGVDQYMMENVASFVPLGESVLPILTSRRVTEYSWDELATAPAYDRIVLSGDTPPEVDRPTPAVTAVSSPPPSPVSSSTPAGLADPELEGLWETQRLTRSSMAATLAAAGLDSDGVAMIVENEGFEEFMIYQVEIREGRWTIYLLPDGESAGVGWEGTYELGELGAVTATDDVAECTIAYEYEVSGDQLVIDLVNDPCGAEDELFQTVIFESGELTRVGEGVVPILTSRRVSGYSWDELAVAPAYDRIALAP